MSDVVRRPQVSVMLLPGGRRTIRGQFGEVDLALTQLQQGGVLMSASAPQPTGVPGEVLVNCRLRPPVQRVPEPAPRRGLSGKAWVAIAAAVLAVLGGLGWLAYEVLVLIVDNALAIVGVLLLAGVVLLGAGRACVTQITIRHHH